MTGRYYPEIGRLPECAREGCNNNVRRKHRICCSPDCAAAYRSQPIEAPKICAVCEASFTRRVSEERRNFRDRKTCSTTCGQYLAADNRHRSVARACAARSIDPKFVRDPIAVLRAEQLYTAYRERGMSYAV